MPFAAAISSARRFQSGSEEETRPLNPNQNDYEDIENPFQKPSVVSKLDKEFSQECLFNTSFFLVMFMVVMLLCLIFALLQWNGVEVPGFPNDNISDC